MKKIALAFAAVLGLTLLAPTSAEAGGCRTRVTYDECGTCLQWEYQCVGHNCYGEPVFRWVIVSRTPRCSYSYGPVGFDIVISGGHRHGGHYRCR
jgi:hypothetical protein